MKKRIWIYQLVIMSLFLLLGNSCKKSDSGQTSVNDLFVGNYLGQTGLNATLEITKVDSKTITLNFKQIPPSTTWDHTFIATVTGTTFSIDHQYWSSSKKFVTAGGTLRGDILTIDYFYSDGSSELGLIYNRVK